MSSELLCSQTSPVMQPQGRRTCTSDLVLSEPRIFLAVLLVAKCVAALISASICCWALVHAFCPGRCGQLDYISEAQNQPVACLKQLQQSSFVGGRCALFLANHISFIDNK